MTEPPHDRQVAEAPPEVAAPEPRPIRLGARRAMFDIVVQIVGRFGNLVLGIAVTLILVHALGARGFGQWSTILAVTQIAINFGDLGLNQVTIMRAVADPEHESSWLGALVSLRVALAGPITLFSIAAVFAVIASSDGRIAGVLLAATILVGAPAALGVVFQLRVRNDISTATMTVNSVLWLIGAAAVSAAGGDIRTFAVVFLVVAAITTVLNVALAARLGRPSFVRPWRRWSPLLRVGVSVAAAGILVTTYVKLDQILVFEFAGSRQAGLYAAAYRILDQAQFIPISVMTTLFPVIASSYPADMPRVRRLLQVAAEYLSMGSLGALAFTIAAAEPIMVLLFGHQFAAAAPALPVLMGAFVLISFGYLFGNMVVLLGLQNLFVLYAAIALAFNVALNVLLIPPFGFKAAAWITLATELLVLSLTARSSLKRLNMRPEWPRFARLVLAAGATGVMTWVARRVGVPLGGLVAIAVVVYPALLIVSGALVPKQLLALIRHEPIA